MSNPEIGTRVGAILKADEHSVELFGYGVFNGYEVPPFGPFGIDMSDYADIVGKEISGNYKEPKITLDDGSVIWGSQCFWCPEEDMRKMIDGRVVKNAKL